MSTTHFASFVKTFLVEHQNCTETLVIVKNDCRNSNSESEFQIIKYRELQKV